MNKMVKIGSLCLIVALFVAGVSGCKNDEGDGWVSTLSGPKIDAIKDLAFTGAGTQVATYAQAYSLVNGFLTNSTGVALADEIESAQYQAFDKAFKAKYDGLSQNQWERLQGKSYSYSVNIDDDTSLKTYVADVTAGTIKGSTKSSKSHSRLTPAEMVGDYRQNDDKNTSSESNSGTISITGGFVQLQEYDDDEDDYVDTYKVAGIVQIETSNKYSSTLKDKEKNISTGSGSSKDKVAVALLISDGTNAAKIRYSSSTGGGWKNRSSGWGGSNDTTDVEVWNLAGTEKLFTIPASRLDNRDAFRDGILGNDYEDD